MAGEKKRRGKPRASSAAYQLWPNVCGTCRENEAVAEFCNLFVSSPAISPKEFYNVHGFRSTRLLTSEEPIFGELNLTLSNLFSLISPYLIPEPALTLLSTEYDIIIHERTRAMQFITDSFNVFISFEFRGKIPSAAEGTSPSNECMTIEMLLSARSS